MRVAMPHGNSDCQRFIEIILVSRDERVLAAVLVVMRLRVVPVLPGKPGPIAVFVPVVVDDRMHREFGTPGIPRSRCQVIRSVSVDVCVGMALVASTSAQVEPCGNRNPATKSDQRQAGRGIDDLTELLGSGDPDTPNNQSKYQR